MFQSIIDFTNALAPIVAALAALWAVKLGRTIHTLVNSNMTRVQADLSIALKRIASLEAFIIKKGKE